MDETTWVQTYTGKQFWPLTPRIEDVDILDIAHGLSLNCRFNGQCDEHLSVAQHSVIVSEHVPSYLALRGLLHDASEAYIPDIQRPIKSAFGNIEEIEGRLLSVIGRAFGINGLEAKNPIIKEADNRTCMTECRDNMKIPPAPWVLAESVEPYEDLHITPMPAHIAEQQFLARYKAVFYKVQR